MLLVKRGELDNKFLLIVLLVVAVVVLSNKEMFTGKAVRTNMNFQPTAEGSRGYVPNIYLRLSLV